MVEKKVKTTVKKEKVAKAKVEKVKVKEKKTKVSKSDNVNTAKVVKEEEKIKKTTKKKETKVKEDTKTEKKDKKEITFADLGLSEKTLEIITKKGFKTPSEIQAKAIPVILEDKYDIVGVAQTGTGKTAAFSLPVIEKIDFDGKNTKVIVLAPTRELALQVADEIALFRGSKRIKVLTVYGGTSIVNQIRDLKSGIDIVVGTPGRVLDLIDRKTLKLGNIEYFILDEADEMLRMGFVEDIELIFERTPESRRVLLFSATMPDRIKQLSKKYMKNQKVIQTAAQDMKKAHIKQIYYKLRRDQKLDVLKNIIDLENFFYGIVFCKTKADVDEITQKLKKSRYEVDCIHGDIAQNKREKILQKFRDLKLNILVATDVAARGIDVENLTHVINFALPREIETYVHRIGRTGRAGKSGTAISFTTSNDDRMIRDIQRVTKNVIERGREPSESEVSEKRDENSKNDIINIVQTKDISNYEKLAKELIKNHGDEKTVAALLYKLDFRRKAQESRASERDHSRDSGRDRNSRDRGDRNDRFSRDKDSSSRGDKIRLFIAKGSEQNFDRRSLLSFILRESGLNNLDARDIKINGGFSFMTVPRREGKRIIDSFAKKNTRRPLVEQASEKRRD